MNEREEREPQQTPHAALVDDPAAGLARVVERNIRALQERRKEEESQRRWPDRVADAITAFAGSMTFVFIHLVVFGLWILVNTLPMVPKGWRFDPSLVVLAMVASVEAIFLSTFVLISQNRMQALADERADLNLQVSLLAEHEITRLVSMVTEIAEKLDIDSARAPELEELARDVAPEQVLDEISRHEQQLTQEREKGGPPAPPR